MLRSTIAIVIILITFAACSKSENTLVPDTIPDDTAQVLTQDVNPFNSGSADKSEGLEVWSTFDILWDIQSGSFTMTDRTADLALRHFKVSYFLIPPQCSDCLVVDLVENDQSLGTGRFKVTLKNHTQLNGYDVRGMLRIKHDENLKLLNADGYSNVFEDPQYISPAPFITYASYISDHNFGSGHTYYEEFELKTTPGTTLVDFTFLITASHPTPAGDVSYIGQYTQDGQLKSGGGSATLTIDVLDLQNDIGGVLLHAGPVGGGEVWMSSNDGRYDAVFFNTTASPGIYELKIDAFSPNYQDAVTSNYYKAVVFHDYDAWRSELLQLVNQDRAANGFGALTIDSMLNTAAQFHAQDMADKEFFSHVNLDGWTPWQRMDYYGIEYSAAGENIAVGHDSPSQVEVAWMDSPGHKANILGSNFGKIGIGIVPCQPGDTYYPGFYWAQVFSN